jgi:hypothetical protein
MAGRQSSQASEAMAGKQSSQASEAGDYDGDGDDNEADMDPATLKVYLINRYGILRVFLIADGYPFDVIYKCDYCRKKSNMADHVLALVSKHHVACDEPCHGHDICIEQLCMC